MTYKQLLRDPRWQKKRLHIFERDQWTCQRCGSTTRELQVHHLAYTGAPWEAPDHLLQTLCAPCHTAEGSESSTPPSIPLSAKDEALYTRLKAIDPGCAELWRRTTLDFERKRQEDERFYERELDKMKRSPRTKGDTP